MMVSSGILITLKVPGMDYVIGVLMILVYLDMVSLLNSQKRLKQQIKKAENLQKKVLQQKFPLKLRLK
jgi:Na+-transporting methylmalonyl-CoA/oxaloacetate decarboxylase gamma subunit